MRNAALHVPVSRESIRKLLQKIKKYRNVYFPVNASGYMYTYKIISRVFIYFNPQIVCFLKFFASANNKSLYRKSTPFCFAVRDMNEFISGRWLENEPYDGSCRTKIR